MSHRFTPHPISDSIWLSDGSFAIAAYNSLFVFCPSESGTGESEPLNLFQDVVRRNGPLLDYHPQNIAQCMLWSECTDTMIDDPSLTAYPDKTQVVHHILRRLFNCLSSVQHGRQRPYLRLEPEEYWIIDPSDRLQAEREVSVARPKQRYGTLFDSRTQEIQQMGLSARELETMRSTHIPGLTTDEVARLVVLATIFSNVCDVRLGLDSTLTLLLSRLRSSAGLWTSMACDT